MPEKGFLSFASNGKNRVGKIHTRRGGIDP
jgi:hypothetical protein